MCKSFEKLEKKYDIFDAFKIIGSTLGQSDEHDAMGLFYFNRYLINIARSGNVAYECSTCRERLPSRSDRAD